MLDRTDPLQFFLGRTDPLQFFLGRTDPLNFFLSRTDPLHFFLIRTDPLHFFLGIMLFVLSHFLPCHPLHFAEKQILNVISGGSLPL